MTRYVLPAVTAVLIGSAALMAPAGASAAAFGLSGLEKPSDGVQQARMRRRHHWRQRYTRRGGMGRRASPSQAGNAKDPNRPVRAQSQGDTTGGPRF